MQQLLESLHGGQISTRSQQNTPKATHLVHLIQLFKCARIDLSDLRVHRFKIMRFSEEHLVNSVPGRRSRLRPLLLRRPELDDSHHLRQPEVILG